MALFQTKKNIKYQLSDEDAHWAMQSWQPNSVGYLRRTIHFKEAVRPEGHGRQRTQFLHRLIMGEPVGLVIDHINGDKLDNRRENLRICTQGQNLENRTKKKTNATSKYIGVHYNNDFSHKNKPWIWGFHKDGKRFGGCAKTEEIAWQTLCRVKSGILI